jgi:hypothetical protein
MIIWPSQDKHTFHLALDIYRDDQRRMRIMNEIDLYALYGYSSFYTSYCKRISSRETAHNPGLPLQGGLVIRLSHAEHQLDSCASELADSDHGLTGIIQVKHLDHPISSRDDLSYVSIFQLKRI